MQQVTEPFDPPPAHTAVILFDSAGDLANVRRIAGRTAAEHGLPAHRVAALEVAVSEIATNTLRHTRSGGQLRVWAGGGLVTCEITDGGTYPPRRPAARPSAGGWGLDIAAEVSDGLHLYSRPGCSIWRLSFLL